MALSQQASRLLAVQAGLAIPVRFRRLLPSIFYIPTNKRLPQPASASLLMNNEISFIFLNAKILNISVVVAQRPAQFSATPEVLSEVRDLQNSLERLPIKMVASAVTVTSR
ncbi:MAG: hypothetical protein ACI9R3_004946 [Verrucomicrobiales bacterium]